MAGETKRLQPCDMISISITPPVIVQGITKLLTLRCSFSDTNYSNSSTTPSTDASTSFHVTSIVVTRGERKGYVATVSTFQDARSLVDEETLQVTGHVNAGETEKALLEMTWTNPGSEQADLYTCEVNIIDDLGHSIVFMKDEDISIRPATVEDLIQYIHKQEVESQRKVTDLEKRVKTLQDQLGKTPHVEQGEVALRNGPEWTQNITGGCFEKDFPISFCRSYDTVPTVHVCTGGVSHDRDKAHDYVVYARDVTKQGFVLVCRVGERDAIYDGAIKWLSFKSDISVP